MIQNYMTKNPKTVKANTLVEEAIYMMEELNIRHLPVVDSGHLVGVISERDICIAGVSEDLKGLKVNSAMTKDPYFVGPETSMSQVLEIMQTNKLGCVVVKGAGEKIEGIFTANDAVRELAKRMD